MWEGRLPTCWPFLALLDYDRRGHEIEISQLSVVCVTIISEPNVQITFKYLFLPMGHTPTHFFCFFVLRIFFVNMGPYWSESFKTLPPTNRKRKLSNLFWIFSPMVLTNLLLGFLKFLKFEFWRILLVVFNVEPNGRVQIHHCSPSRNKTSNIWKTSDRRATLPCGIWDSWVVVKHRESLNF